MIFRCGITGSGRKATCRNGSASDDAEALGRRAQRNQRLAHLLEAHQAHQAGDRQRQFGEHLAAARHGEAALDVDQPVDRDRHVGLVGADDA